MNILFVVVVPFPFGDASSIRAFNLCKLIKLAGHQVHVISDYPSKTAVSEPLTFCTYEDAESKYDNGSIALKCLHAVEAYLDKNPTDVIMMNARYDRYDKMAQIAKKRNLKLIIESCEWYDPSSFRLGRLDPRYWKNEKMIRCGFKKADGFISISELLDEHNSGFGKVSVRIPTILDVQGVAWKERNDHKKLELVYAGSLGKSKELLGPIIRVLADNEGLRNRIVLHVYGPSAETVEKNTKEPGLLKKVGGSVIIHGRVPQPQVQDIMRNADFVFFMRPQRRSSDAGFPTKLGESMSVGTPVMTNDTGDIAKYVRSGENGLLIASTSDDAVRDTLIQAINMSADELAQMRKSTRTTAEVAFEYRRYVASFSEMMSKVSMR